MKNKYLILLSLIAFVGLYACGATDASDVSNDSDTSLYTSGLDEPTVSLDSGTYLKGQTFTVTHDTAGVKYAITTDGTDPKPEDASISAGSLTFTIDHAVTYKIMAVKDYKYSDIVTREFSVTTESTDASSPMALTENTRYDLSLQSSGDKHFFTIDTVAGEDYYIRTFSETDNLNTMIYVYDNLSDMQTAATTLNGTTTYTSTNESFYNNDEDVDDDDTAYLTKQSIIHIKNASGNKYYILVKAQNDSDTGDYKITTKNITNHNNGDLTLGTWYTHTLSSTLYEHIYKTPTLSTGTTYRFNINPNNNAIIFSFQVIGTGLTGTKFAVEYAGYTNSGTNTYFDFTVSEDGYYYIVITGYDDTNRVSIELSGLDGKYDFMLQSL